ncbi:MAG: acyltransferase [Bacteroidales bacterium]
MDPVSYKDLIRDHDSKTFRELSLEVFRYQARENAVYREYLRILGSRSGRVSEPEDIPFLPIEFFRNHRVVTGDREPALVFESSGTTGAATSRHWVADPALYEESLLRGFHRVFGDPRGMCILALLPSYLERGGSSLVHMMKVLMDAGGHPDNGFYLDDFDRLSGVLRQRNGDGTPTLLVGVSFALLDLAESHSQVLGENITLVETGGMKGRRTELIRSELHAILGRAFGKERIFSEYGMTELLSQAWSTGGGLFQAPPWLKVLIRDPNDPFGYVPEGRTGGINLIDLANLHSCAFLATGDLGKIHADGRFEVLGRFDHATVRGCNLLVP